MLVRHNSPRQASMRSRTPGRAARSACALDEAIALFEQALADYERVLGETHPSTLVSRNNRAYAYQEAGRLTRLRTWCERSLNPDHQDREPYTLG
jgi:hypothetical protein